MPARLSQNTLSSSVGLLNVVFASVCDPGKTVVDRRRRWSGSLFVAVDSPAGARVPSLVIAVAVVRLRATVLPTRSTKTASSRAMPPPSWAEMLLTTLLSAIEIVRGVGAGRRRPRGLQQPDPATVVVGDVGGDHVVVDRGRAGPPRELGRGGRQLAGDHDAAALVVGAVEPDPVVADVLGPAL